MSGNVEAHDYREPGELQNIGFALSSNSALSGHMPSYMEGFLRDIERMNAMYRMPVVDIGTASQRLKDFHDILFEECKEIDELNDLDTNREIALKTALADLLGDIIVYCASEARRWNIPIDRTLSIIMQSNFSKLGEDGQPIYDERMKLLKGPNYWKPEPKIERMLCEWISGEST